MLIDHVMLICCAVLQVATWEEKLPHITAEEKEKLLAGEWVGG